MTTASRRNFMSALCAYVGAGIVLGSSQTADAANKAQEKKGLVISSNKDIELAQLAVEMAREAGLEKAYIQEVKAGGETFYRTVYPLESESYIPGVKEVLKKLNYFSLDEAFKVPLNLKNRAPIKKSSHTPNNKVIKKSDSSLEKKVVQEETVRMVSQEEVQKAEGNLSLNNYLAMFTPHVMETHKGYWKKEISREKAEQVLTYIYQNAKEFKTPLIRAVSIYLHESKGDPDFVGDTKFAPNVSIGPYQMRLSTIDYVRKKMTLQGIRGFSNESPTSLQGDYASLVRLGVWYFANNMRNANGSSDIATVRHNAGHGSKLRKSSYLTKVKTEERALKDAIGSSN